MAAAIKKAGFRIELITRDRSRAAISRLGLFDDVHIYESKFPIQLKSQDSFPSYIARNIDIEFNDFATDIIRRNPPQAVVSHYAWTSSLFAALPPEILTVLDTIDIQFRRSTVAISSGVKQFDRMAGKKEELRELRKAQVVVAIQQEEKRIFQQLLPDRKIICAEHTFATKSLGSPDDSRTLLFVGSNYDPNIRGLARFIEKTWPKIRSSVPSAILQVCGKVCESLYDFHNTPGIQLEGMVSDIEAYYRKAAVVINVALYGTGLPIKTSEALAFGKCVVCNAAGARGFDCALFPGAISDYDNMSEHIVPLLVELSMRRQMEAATVAYARRYMAPEVVFEELIDALRKAEPHISSAGIRVPSQGFLFKLRNYPLRKLYYHYVTAFVSRWFNYQGSTATDSRLLELYLRLRWEKLERDNGFKRVAVFASGKHTKWLEWVLRDIPVPEVIAVLDDNPPAHGKLFGLSPSHAKDFDPSSADAIVLSSDCIQEKLAIRCRELYSQHVRLIDLYEDLPPGPYSKR